MDAVAILTKMAVLVFAVVMHEVAHGYVAYRLGDPTALNAGRLTLNPIPHIDPIGTIILPLMLSLTGGPTIGWAKPVPVNFGYFRHPRRDSILVSIAGVTTNMAIALVAAALYRVLAPDASNPIAILLVMTCVINVWLAAFNMIPIPPLDGSHVFAEFLSPRAAEKYMSLGRFGILIIFVLFNMGLGEVMWRVVLPVLTALLGHSANWIGVLT